MRAALAGLWLLSLLCRTCLAGNNTLQLLHVLYRHGARTPIELYANDTNAAHFWSGLGQLTNEGKEMQYNLGKFLRRRYDDFLHKKYHMNYTHVISSDVDRTLMSAQVNMAGLYPPVTAQQWTPDLAWQPIPVHTRPTGIDYVMRFLDSCQIYMDDRNALKESTYVRDLNTKYAALFKHLSKHCGSSITSVVEVGWLYGTLSIEDSHGLPIPEWARFRLPEYNATAYPELMRPLNDISFQLMSHTEQMKQLGGGLMLSDMMAHMQQKVSDVLQPENRQLFVYSGHDFNVAAFLSTLGDFNGIAPPPASCVMVELHKNASSGEFYVEMFYRNGTGDELYPVSVRGCAHKCPWKTFQVVTAPMRTADAAAACRPAPPPPPPPHPNDETTTEMVLEGLVAGLLLLLFVGSGIALCRSRRRNNSDFRYSALDTN